MSAAYLILKQQTANERVPQRLRVEAKSCVAYSRLSKVHVLFVLPDPGALNYCMHTFLR